MKKLFTILLLFSASMAGQPFFARSAAAELFNTLEAGLHGGFRLDQYDWNIAGSLAGQNPNVLSELDWEDLEIWQLGINGKLGIGTGTAAYLPYIIGSIDYGWITDGSVRDSDYGGDNRTMEYSRSLSVTEDDSTLDFSIGFGLEKKFRQDLLTLGILGGYSYHEQNLRITKGVQVIPDFGPFPGLNSTYASKWYGPFAGINFELQPKPHFSLYGSVEYHWSDYEAEADWNLIDLFAHPVSFKHETEEADGVVITLGGSYQFRSSWTLDLAYIYRDYTASDGIEVTFWADGSPPTPTKFNEANWQSSAINLGITYRF